MHSIIRLPAILQRQVEEAIRAHLNSGQSHAIDFTRPSREEALVGADSVSWRIFKNPVALFVGGVTAVILELAEPAVRAGVWEHSSFRQDPVRRLRRTGMAAMVTVYGARSIAESMIAGVVRRHASVGGRTPDGAAYSANDPRLLGWVHVTAVFSFAQAYSRYVEPLSACDFNSFYGEGTEAAHLYGVPNAPRSAAGIQNLLDGMQDTLGRSPIIFQFLRIMCETGVFPATLRWLQPILVRAAVDLLPGGMRQLLGLESHGLRSGERWLVRLAGDLCNRIIPLQSPATQSCIRLGLPTTYLYT